MTKKINIVISRKDAYGVYSCLRELAKMRLNAYLKFDIGHNVNKLRENFELCEALRNDNSDIEGFEDYQKGIKEIMLKHSKGGKIEGTEAIAAYEQELVQFRSEHPTVIKDIDKKQKEFGLAIETCIEVDDLVLLDIAKLPEELDLDITPIIQLIERNEDA